ncbi:MAG: hypothetical protein OXN89_20710 [Bryobacterales bacterium]|nr:hypothetical protein [Bryobacterales bacterium]
MSSPAYGAWAGRRAEAAARLEAERKAEQEAAARKATEARLAAMEARLGRGGLQRADDS